MRGLMGREARENDMIGNVTPKLPHDGHGSSASRYASGKAIGEFSAQCGNYRHQSRITYCTLHGGFGPIPTYASPGDRIDAIVGHGPCDSTSICSKCGGVINWGGKDSECDLLLTEVTATCSNEDCPGNIMRLTKGGPKPTRCPLDK